MQRWSAAISFAFQGIQLICYLDAARYGATLKDYVSAYFCWSSDSEFACLRSRRTVWGALVSSMRLDLPGYGCSISSVVSGLLGMVLARVSIITRPDHSPQTAYVIWAADVVFGGLFSCCRSLPWGIRRGCFCYHHIAASEVLWLVLVRNLSWQTDRLGAISGAVAAGAYPRCAFVTPRQPF